MTKLNHWNSAWTLDPEQCPCDIHFVEYLAEHGIKGRDIFHMGTGAHHLVGLETARSGAGNQVLAITASREEYSVYIDMLINNPRLGFTYKVYFGDIYQIDARLLPRLDYATLFHCGEYRTKENESYGAITDEAVALVLADQLRPGGEIHFFIGSFAYDVAKRTGGTLVAKRGFADLGTRKSLHIFKKPL